MAGKNENAIIDVLSWIADAEKSFDAAPQWTTVTSRGSYRLELVVAVRLEGILQGGASIRLATPYDAWERDLYGHVEVRIPGVSRTLRLNPIEWRPLRHHDNPASAPEAHRLIRLWDRWLPFDQNKKMGLGAFDQSAPGVAVPLPRDLTSFTDYADLCAELWRCPDMMGIQPPPWSGILV